MKTGKYNQFMGTNLTFFLIKMTLILDLFRLEKYLLFNV